MGPELLSWDKPILIYSVDGTQEPLFFVHNIVNIQTSLLSTFKGHENYNSYIYIYTCLYEQSEKKSYESLISSLVENINAVNSLKKCV